MRAKLLVTVAVAGLLGMPLAAQAGDAGAAAGATTGAIGGAIVGGPIGAAVGGAAGAIVGGLAPEQTPRFREYVVREHVPSYRYSEQVTVGTVLPEDDIEYYEVPREFGVTRYRYTVVNNRPVLVEPQTRRVVQIIE